MRSCHVGVRWSARGWCQHEKGLEVGLICVWRERVLFGLIALSTMVLINWYWSRKNKKWHYWPIRIEAICSLLEKKILFLKIDQSKEMKFGYTNQSANGNSCSVVDWQKISAVIGWLKIYWEAGTNTTTGGYTNSLIRCTMQYYNSQEFKKLQ